MHLRLRDEESERFLVEPLSLRRRRPRLRSPAKIQSFFGHGGRVVRLRRLSESAALGQKRCARRARRRPRGRRAARSGSCRRARAAAVRRAAPQSEFSCRRSGGAAGAGCLLVKSWARPQAPHQRAVGHACCEEV